jgi:hypothetical protein
MVTVSSAKPQWRAVLRPKWLCWHAFAVVAFFGMLWLGDWQWHCALSGNTLSWAYTFEWPLFAIFGVVFWVRTVRDEVGLTAIRSARRASQAGTGTAAATGSDAAAGTMPARTVAGSTVAASTGAARTGAARTVAAGTVAASTRAASTGAPDDDAGLTRSHRRESESQEEYAARLIAEIRGDDRGKWRAFGNRREPSRG